MPASALGRAAGVLIRDAPKLSQRRFRSVNLSVFVPVLVSVGALLVVRQAETAVQAAVLSAGVLAAVVAFERWTAGEVHRVALPCLVVAAVVWPYGVFAIDGDRQAAFFAVAVVTGLVAPALPRRRLLVAFVAVGYVAAVGIAGVVLGELRPNDSSWVQQVVAPTGITAVLIGIMFPNRGFYDVMTELEEAREREAELAVARERIRFAGDLHDIQGHTLHVVKMKVALASKLLSTDVARAGRELDEVGALVADTITQTRELAHGHRTLNLSAELENARTLLAATGAHVEVGGGVSSHAPAAELMAQVLRETTTNILRHSRAQSVRIAISDHGIDIVNDGHRETGPPQLQGLATLMQRVADAGGRLTAEVDGASFRTTAVFDPAATVPGQTTLVRSTDTAAGGPARARGDQ